MEAFSAFPQQFQIVSTGAMAARTQSDYRGYSENRRQYFGKAPPEDVTADDVFDYLNARAEK